MTVSYLARSRQASVPSALPVLAAAVLAIALAPIAFSAEKPTAEYPKIKQHGGVFPIKGAGPARPGSKVVVDVTSGAEDGGVNKGFARAARFVNLLTIGGAKDFKVAVVLHGGATKESLSNEAYQQHFGKPNPNAALVKQLRDAGVRVLVCGQSLTHAGYNPGQTSSDIEVALSAATTIIDYQMQGYAYLPIP